MTPLACIGAERTGRPDGAQWQWQRLPAISLRPKGTTRVRRVQERATDRMLDAHGPDIRGE